MGLRTSAEYLAALAKQRPVVYVGVRLRSPERCCSRRHFASL